MRVTCRQTKLKTPSRCMMACQLRQHVAQRQVHLQRSPLACMASLRPSRQPSARVTAQTGRIGITTICSTTNGNRGSPQLSNACVRLHSVAGVSRRRCRRAAALPPLAMINVDFASPSLVLGIALIGCGVALLQVRNLQREVSRDADIVVAAMISIVGSTLIFQGWRLDPLLLLCQALTTSVAFWYGLETFKLRQQVVEDEEEAGIVPPPEGFSSQMPDLSSYTAAQRPGFLPPAADRPLPPWQQQQQQQQQPVQGMGGAPGASRWGLPPGDPSLPFDYYTGGPTGTAESAYAGYEDQQQQSLAGGFGGQQQVPSLQQQQQQAPGGPGLGYGSSSYGSSSYNDPRVGSAGVYGQPQQQYGMLPPQQQQQQPGQPPFGGDVSWYGVGDVPPAGGAYGPGAAPQLPSEAFAGQQQLQYGVGLLPDGSSYSAAAAAGALPLPPAGQQQPQQQRRPGGGAAGGDSSGGGASAGSGRAYEQVDDWE